MLLQLFRVIEIVVVNFCAWLRLLNSRIITLIIEDVWDLWLVDHSYSYLAMALVISTFSKVYLSSLRGWSSFNFYFLFSLSSATSPRGAFLSLFSPYWGIYCLGSDCWGDKSCFDSIPFPFFAISLFLSISFYLCVVLSSGGFFYFLFCCFP